MEHLKDTKTPHIDKTNSNTATNSQLQTLCQQSYIVPFSPQTTPSRLSIESTWSPLRPTPFHHCIASLHSHKGIFNAIAVMRSHLVLTGSDSSRIRAWRRFDCMEVGYIKASTGGVRCMLARGDMLFTSHKDNKIRIWNVGVCGNGGRINSKKITTLPKSSSSFNFFSRASVQHQHKYVISCMTYYSVEEILYTGSWDKSIKAWRVCDQKCIDSFVAHEDIINALVVNQDDGCLFSASSDGTVKIWRRAYGGCSHSLTMTLKFQNSPVNALAFSVSTNGSFLYSGSSDGYTNFWVKEKLSCRYNHGGFLEGHMFGVLCLIAIDNLVISGSEDTTIRVWRRENGLYHECLVILEGHKGPVKCLNARLELDSQRVTKALYIYSASLDQTLKVWRVDVMPDNDAYASDGSNNGDDDGVVGRNSISKPVELEMSPVLSPVWVEKKLQIGN